MDIGQAFPSDYLKASDLQGRNVNVTMDRVEMVDLGGEHKPALFFAGKEKGMVLNKTNANTISDIYGGETTAWTGQPITLFPSQVDYQGRQVACIRVKLTPPAAATPQQAQQPPADGPDFASDNSVPF